jgi:predicted transposase YbfD/YdcC
VNKGHGRVEKRTLVSTTALNSYLGWPAVGQVFRLERSRTVKGQTTREVVYGITSLTRAQAGAERLLELVRCHWSIENQLFGARDTTLGEDACRVRTGSAPEVLAGLRNIVLHLLKGVHSAGKRAATRLLSARPALALALLAT